MTCIMKNILEIRLSCIKSNFDNLSLNFQSILIDIKFVHTNFWHISEIIFASHHSSPKVKLQNQAFKSTSSDGFQEEHHQQPCYQLAPYHASASKSWCLPNYICKHGCSQPPIRHKKRVRALVESYDQTLQLLNNLLYDIEEVFTRLIALTCRSSVCVQLLLEEQESYSNGYSVPSLP